MMGFLIDIVGTIIIAFLCLSLGMKIAADARDVEWKKYIKQRYGDKL